MLIVRFNKMNIEKLKKLGAVKIGLIASVIFMMLYVAADQLIAFAFDPTGRYGNKIIMYSTSTCPYCKRLRKCFAQSKLKYEEKNIRKDFLAHYEFMALRARGVPVVLVGNDVVYGYGIEKLNNILSKSNRKLLCNEI